jgi:hypothetical protein
MASLLVILAGLLCVLLFAGGMVALTVLIVVQSVQKKGSLGVNFDPTQCAGCGAKLPTIRKPANVRQALWGGWTCRNCGCEMDKWGRPLRAPPPQPGTIIDAPAQGGDSAT